MTTENPAGDSAGGGSFVTSEGLRSLLHRLSLDPGAWRSDPEASALLEFCATRYAALARKHGQHPLDAAAAAFSVLRAPATARARDPWAVVTHAVRLTLATDERADALLCSTSAARRLLTDAGLRPVVRLGDHTAIGPHDTETATEEGTGPGGLTPVQVRICMANAVELLCSLGWPRTVAELAVTHVCDRLATTGNPQRAYEALRHDLTLPRLLDVPPRTWTTLCRVLVGPSTSHPNTSHPGGVLRRLLTGEPVRALLADDTLVATLLGARPHVVEAA